LPVSLLMIERPEATADGVHYPGTYAHGGYNRETTILGGRPVLNEDLVNLPNWLVLKLRIEDEEAIRLDSVELLSYLHEYDVLVLDRRLPDGDGITLCRGARDKGFANGILMLTAMDDARSTIAGLDESADDSPGKPFDVEVP